MRAADEPLLLHLSRSYGIVDAIIQEYLCKSIGVRYNTVLLETDQIGWIRANSQQSSKICSI